MIYTFDDEVEPNTWTKEKNKLYLCSQYIVLADVHCASSNTKIYDYFILLLVPIIPYHIIGDVEDIGIARRRCIETENEEEFNAMV